MTEQILAALQTLLHGLHGEDKEEIALAVSQLKTHFAQVRSVLAEQDTSEALDQLHRRKQRLAEDVDRLTRLEQGSAS